jgi:hypothetical protein
MAFRKGIAGRATWRGKSRTTDGLGREQGRSAGTIGWGATGYESPHSPSIHRESLGSEIELQEIELQEIELQEIATDGPTIARG